MSKLKAVVSTFGRQMFDLYDRHPLLCNTIAGSAVYSAGELIVQHQRSSVAPAPATPLDYKRIGQIGALGGVENGVFMLLWYNALNSVVGSSKATLTVLIKCFFDQVFFAAQSDGAFLLCCAVQGKKSLEDAMREVKKTFMTTWINDCSIWPLVNFIGFAAVPVKIQPTFMSTIQLGWQVYLSNVAAPRDEVSSPSGTSTSAEITDVNTVDDSRLLASFRMIDLDGNGFLDTAELQTALAMRGHKVGTLEVKKMMLEANKKYGRQEDGDRRVSFEAFRRIVKKVRGKKHF